MMYSGLHFLCAQARSLIVLVILTALALVSPARAQTAAVDPAKGMDQAIALLIEARLQFQNVRDYECRSVNRERVNGVLLPETVMHMKARNRPFSIYLRSESPEAERGMQICYVEGRNQGRMRVHPPGIQGALGFWSIDPQDPRALEKHRHCITEAGLGNILESTARYWEMERRLNATLVFIRDEECAGRICTRIDTVHPDRQAGTFYGYHCVLWLDRATHLPVGAETYDWPRPGGPAEGDLLESYRFLNLRCNVGIREETFNH
jgi:hypothetical protein